jgi:hypothetical protein
VQGARLDLYARRVRHLTADDPAEVDALGAALLPPAAPAPSSGRFSVRCAAIQSRSISRLICAIQTACPPSTLCPSSSSAPHPCARTCPNSGADGPPPPAPARPLLPRLRTLHATASSPRALQALARLAPPTLQLVDIHALFPPSDPCLGLGDSFRALRGLRTLAFDLPLAPAPAILGALGALPALRDLRLALAPLDPSCEPWVAPASAFPELRTLALSGPHAAHTHCLRALPALPALESAALVLTPPGGAPAALEALLKARAPRLRDLDICDEEELDDSDMESEPDEDAPRDVLALVPGPGPAVVVF